MAVFELEYKRSTKKHFWHSRWWHLLVMTYFVSGSGAAYVGVMTWRGWRMSLVLNMCIYVDTCWICTEVFWKYSSSKDKNRQINSYYLFLNIFVLVFPSVSLLVIFFHPCELLKLCKWNVCAYHFIIFSFTGDSQTIQEKESWL